MCKYIYYSHVNIYTHLCASHMLKSHSSSSNLLLIALLQFMLSSLRLKIQRSLFHLHCLWYSKLWVSSPFPPFLLSPMSARVAPSPLVSTHLSTDHISRIRFLSPSAAQTHSMAPCAAQIAAASGGVSKCFAKQPISEVSPHLPHRH